jgi:PAS domain S-box-containing protein
MDHPSYWSFRRLAGAALVASTVTILLAAHDSAMQYLFPNVAFLQSDILHYGLAGLLAGVAGYVIAARGDQLNQRLAAELETRKQTERAMRESERKLRSLIERSGDGIYLADEQGRVVEWNPAMAQISGVDAGEALGQFLWDIMYRLLPEEGKGALSCEGLRTALLAILASGQSPVLNRVSEATIQRADGTRRLAQQVIFAIPAEHGYMASTIVRDVTEQKQAEQELGRLKEFNEQIVQSMHEGIILENADGIINFVNQAGASLLGYAPEELLGQPWTRITPPQQYEAVSEARERRARGESDRYDTERVRKDGSPLDVSISGSPWLEDGRIVGSAAVFSDITDLKRVHQALDYRARQMACLYVASLEISSLSDSPSLLPTVIRQAAVLIGARCGAIYLLDADSQALKMVSEYGLEAGGTRPSSRHPGEGLLGQVVQTGQALALGCTHDAGTQEMAANREPPGSALVTPLSVRNRVIGVMTVCDEQRVGRFSEEDAHLLGLFADHAAIIIENARLNEVTRHHAAELEERVAERTAELSGTAARLLAANVDLEKAARLKDEFLASMSHELRTPLNAILVLSENLEENVYGPVTDKQFKSLKTIRESGQHLLALINDVLDLAKIGAGKVELVLDLVSVQDICKASLRLIGPAAAKKGLTTSLDLDPTVSTFTVDGRRLKQMLGNLLNNAVKFTPEGGAIGLEVAGDRRNGVVRFTVWDTGIGIAGEDTSRLFQPFIQLDARLSREYAGTGMGLNLVKRLVELHGGTVSVESALGKGSRFTVSLPWSPAPADKAEAEDRSADALSAPDGTDHSQPKAV